jgi:hypothetical protein
MVKRAAKEARPASRAAKWVVIVCAMEWRNAHPVSI